MYEEERHIGLSTLQNDLHLSDSDSDDEASDSDAEYDNDLFDSSFATINDNTFVQARLSTINESAIDFSDYRHGSENDSADEASSHGESTFSSEENWPSDTGDISSDDDDDDSAIDDSSSSQGEASTNDQPIHRISIHRASCDLIPTCISSTGIANTESQSNREARGQKRKRQSEDLQYPSKRRKTESPISSTSTGVRKRQGEGLLYPSKRTKMESPIPSTSTGVTGSRKNPAFGLFENDTFRADAASSDGESASSSDEGSSSDTDYSFSDDEDDYSAFDGSNKITNDQLVHRGPLCKVSDVLMSSSAGIANTEDLSYLEARGQKRKRQDKGLHYHSKKRRIESPVPSTSAGFTGRRKRRKKRKRQDKGWHYPSKKKRIESPVPSTSAGFTGRRKRRASGSIDKETENRAPKKQRVYPDTQLNSCPNTCPCKTRGQADEILPIDRTFKVIKPLYIKLLQSRTLVSHNLSQYQCCEKHCSFRWYQRQVPVHMVLDDYWDSDLGVYNFSWGQWKDGEGYV